LRRRIILKVSIINRVLKEDLKGYFENIHRLLDEKPSKEKSLT